MTNGRIKPHRKRVVGVSECSMIDLRHQREQNLRAMRSPASIALAVCSITAVILASVFYDHPVMKQPQIFASFRQYIATQ